MIDSRDYHNHRCEKVMEINYRHRHQVIYLDHGLWYLSRALFVVNSLVVCGLIYFLMFVVTYVHRLLWRATSEETKCTIRSTYGENVSLFAHWRQPPTDWRDGVMYVGFPLVD